MLHVLRACGVQELLVHRVELIVYYAQELMFVGNVAKDIKITVEFALKLFALAHNILVWTLALLVQTQNVRRVRVQINAQLVQLELFQILLGIV